MKKRDIILSLTLGALSLAGATAGAQEARVTRVTMPQDSVATVRTDRADYGKLLGIKDYESLPGDALLPITREEAEEVISAMIVAARAPGQEAINRAKVLNDFKVETLRRRLLDDALRKSYTEEYERRLDKLENFILLLLANNGLSPNAINNLVSGLTGTQPGSAAVIPAGQNGATGTSSSLVPGASDGSNPVALRPGAKAASWEHFLSRVFYGYDSSKLDEEAKKVLDDVAGWIKETGMGVTLRGWASPEGKMSYNNKLSARRVQAAADYLKKQGISEGLLKVIPSGIDSMKDTKSKYPAGRRVDIRPDYGEKAL